MARALRPIGHEDRLTLVDHLDELRKRLVISIIGLLICFAFCFWQNHAILDIVNKPVEDAQSVRSSEKKSKDPNVQATRFLSEQRQALQAGVPALSLTGETLQGLRDADNVTAAQRRQLDKTTAALALAAKEFAQAAQAVPDSSQNKLTTLGVTEPFTATITITFYAALLLAMPLLLYQAYAFVLPAFSPRERRVALPLMLMVPVLFVTGVLFGYFVVLDRAVEFLQNFNAESFNNLLQAKDYFKFAIFFVAAIGLLFQIPVGVLAITRLGILTPKQLASNRGYVILGIAIVAAVATPTPDPVTMTLAMAPLIVLFELSILLARWIDRVKPIEDDDDDPDDDDDDEDDDDGPGDDPLAGYDDDDLDDDEAGPPDLTAAAEAVQQASQSDSPKLEGQDRIDPDSKD